jgi:hypothetical protein
MVTAGNTLKEGYYIGDILRTSIFYTTRPAFLCGAVRVRGSGGGEIKVRILE